MKNYTEEEIKYIKQNKEEVINYIKQNEEEIINYLTDHMKRLDLKLKLKEKELNQLPTKEERIKRVLQISKELQNGKD
jgi:hypothetical protein